MRDAKELQSRPPQKVDALALFDLRAVRAEDERRSAVAEPTQFQSSNGVAIARASHEIVNSKQIIPLVLGEQSFLLVSSQ